MSVLALNVTHSNKHGGDDAEIQGYLLAPSLLFSSREKHQYMKKACCSYPTYSVFSLR